MPRIKVLVEAEEGLVDDAGRLRSPIEKMLELDPIPCIDHRIYVTGAPGGILVTLVEHHLDLAGSPGHHVSLICTASHRWMRAMLEYGWTEVPGNPVSR